MLPMVGRYADAWHAFGSIDDLKRMSAIVDEHARASGRDPASILRATSLSISEPWDEVRKRAADVGAAGFEYVVVGWPSEGRARLEEFVSDVMPELG
jgi:alkanesulfonate monooxygenase SsuD/methylene tetrahydromethanopterin reductase-like flavin-dependent oxidoreductase (luciferase family)